jgi:hypothetical protein
LYLIFKKNTRKGIKKIKLNKTKFLLLILKNIIENNLSGG